MADVEVITQTPCMDDVEVTTQSLSLATVEVITREPPCRCRRDHTTPSLAGVEVITQHPPWLLSYCSDSQSPALPKYNEYKSTVILVNKILGT